MSVQFRLELTLQELWKIVKDCKKCREKFLDTLVARARKAQEKNLRENVMKILDGGEQK